MRSIQIKIVVWCVCVLLGSFAGFFALVAWQSNTSQGPGRLLLRLTQVIAEHAFDLYDRSDSQALRKYLARMDETVTGTHHLVDRDGRDVLTGTNYAALLRAADRVPVFALPMRGQIILAVPSQNGRLFLLVRRPAPNVLQSQIPFFLLILAAITFFCSILAVDIASPLKKMAVAMQRFGAGALDARLEIRRRDEIGQLGEAFDQMTGRIQALLHAERQLLQDVSHELRSPLARLGVSIQLAKCEPGRDAALTQMERELARLDALIGDLISMTRAEGELTSRHFEIVRLDLLARDLCDTCHLEASQKQCSIHFTNHAGEAELLAAPELLWRAVENVLRNAIRYAPNSTEIHLTLALASADSFDLTIRDVGPGIPEADLTLVFHPFYRTDPARQQDTGGIGLGLSIAERAIRFHHGQIWASNASPGLRVTIRLPRPRLAAASLLESSPALLRSFL